MPTAAWFVLDQTGSSPSCVVSYSLFDDALCTTPSTFADIYLVGSSLTINLNNGFGLKTLYLRAMTNGKVSAVRPLEIEVCGTETVSLTGSSSVSYSYMTAPGSSVVPAAWTSFFAVNSAHCPIVYSLWTFNGSTYSSYTGPVVSISGTNDL